MSVAAENKRRVLAAIAALVVLMAIGFAIGRAISGPPHADAAGRSPAAAPLTQRSPATGHSAAITALKADLARSRRTSSTTAQQLANVRAANRRLGRATAKADRESSRVRYCHRRRAPRRFRRCVTDALSR